MSEYTYVELLLGVLTGLHHHLLVTHVLLLLLAGVALHHHLPVHVDHVRVLLLLLHLLHLLLHGGFLHHLLLLLLGVHCFLVAIHVTTDWARCRLRRRRFLHGCCIVGRLLLLRCFGRRRLCRLLLLLGCRISFRLLLLLLGVAHQLKSGAPCFA